MTADGRQRHSITDPLHANDAKKKKKVTLLKLLIFNEHVKYYNGCIQMYLNQLLQVLRDVQVESLISFLHLLTKLSSYLKAKTQVKYKIHTFVNYGGATV